MTSPDRSLEQVALDRVHSVARQRPAARPEAPHGRSVDRGPVDAAGELGDLRPVGAEPAVAAGVPTASSTGRRARRRAATSPPELLTPHGWSPGDEARWTPVPPAVGDPVGPPTADVADVADAADVADVAVRSRTEALAAAAAGYTRAYGHPLDHPGEEAPAHGRRWWLSTRHAVVAGVAVAVLSAGIVVRATTQVPDPPVDLAVTQVAPADEVAADPAGGPTVGPEDGVAPGAGTGAAAGAAGAGGAADPAAPGPPPAPGVVVHVVGQVPTPGVLTLPAGSRVSDAVAAAGGPGPDADLTLVNLARVVVDGEQIHVPARGEVVRPPAGGAAGSAGPPTAGTPTAPVPLNTADLAALDALPGIGPVLAQRILDWRTDNGPFRSVEELGEVSGIGEAMMARLRPLVRV